MIDEVEVVVEFLREILPSYMYPNRWVYDPEVIRICDAHHVVDSYELIATIDLHNSKMIVHHLCDNKITPYRSWTTTTISLADPNNKDKLLSILEESLEINNAYEFAQGK